MPNISIKSLKLTALLLLSPLFLFAQTLTGLWTGSLHNDSATIRKDQSFEIALTEYKDKVYGYSRSEFIVNDTLYYIVKRVKGAITGDICEVMDDEIVAYNFRGKLDKGVKVTSIFRRNKGDSSWYLDGTWKTNVTKKYYAVTGKVGLEEEKDLYASKLFPHLEELNLANDVAFYKEYKEEKDRPVIAKIAKPEKIKSEYNDRPLPLSSANDVAIAPAKPNLQKAESGPVATLSTVETIPAAESTSDIVKIEQPEILPSVKKPEANLQKTDTKFIPATTVAITPTQATKTIAEPKRPEKIVTTENTTIAVTNKPLAEDKQITSAPIAKNIVKKEKEKPIQQPDNKLNQDDKKNIAAASLPSSSAITTTTQPKKPEVISVTLSNTTPEKKEIKTIAPVVTTTPEIKQPVVDVIAKASVIGGRKSEFTQIVNFKSDSLELSLYDNGEIDGDTVSVFLNGEVLMSKQGLKASAIKKTIYITPGNEDFTLVMFAENLGKYPPNTGLLVVHDGEDVYNLRFSSDFQKSSGIVFKRKK